MVGDLSNLEASWATPRRPLATGWHIPEDASPPGCLGKGKFPEWGKVARFLWGPGMQKKLLVADILPAEAPRIFHASQICPAPALAQKPLKGAVPPSSFHP